MEREPDTIGALLDELRLAHGANARLDRCTDELETRLTRPGEFKWGARRIVEIMALARQASLLLRYSAPDMADAFCATRLDGDRGQAFGTLQNGLSMQAIIDRARIVTAA